ncbi:MAG TPA: hypothetical protein VGN38_13785 [Caulobacteraceae bacterium]|jgi:hypothetical protein|nr:hypothetical protein [Caulobacteraceae bacterium]
MTKIELTLAVEHGVMFLHGAGEGVSIPDDTGVKNISITENCVSFRVKTYVDGDAIVELGDPSISNFEEQEYFSGSINCMSKSISLSDSYGFVYASLPLDAEIAAISIKMSEAENPDWVKCIVHNLASF